MVEVRAETIYVNKHKQKIAFVLAAMRHLWESLRLAGFPIDYVDFEDPANSGDFTGELARAVSRHRPEQIVVTEPGEWRVLEMMRSWPERLGLKVEMRGDDRFVCSRDRFARWAAGRKEFRLEHFYREMRRETGLLMEDGKPISGRWNFDFRQPQVAARGRPGAAAGALRAGRDYPRCPSPRRRALLRSDRRSGAIRLGGNSAGCPQGAGALRSGLPPDFGDYQDAMKTGHLYDNLDRMPPERAKAIRREAEVFLAGMYGGPDPPRHASLF